MKKNDFLAMNAERERRILAESRDFYNSLLKEYFGKKPTAQKPCDRESGRIKN